MWDKMRMSLAASHKSEQSFPLSFWLLTLWSLLPARFALQLASDFSFQGETEVLALTKIDKVLRHYVSAE